MGDYWLDDLPDVVAGAGLRFRLWDGWETRSRSSGGYDAVWAVFAHHTASSASPDGDCSYMWDATGGDQPIGALYLDRDGIVTIGAAGATNCQGKGGPWTLSHGTIPQDKGNAYGIAIEAANDGVGEPWPDAQCDAYTMLVAALCDAYDLDPGRDVLAHFEWVEPSCPGRKVDPLGQSPWASGAVSWDMAAFRADAATTPEPEPEPEPEVIDVSDEDVQRIAAAVWAYMLTDPTVNKQVTAATLFGYTRGAASNADRQTRPEDPKNTIAADVWAYKMRSLTE